MPFIDNINEYDLIKFVYLGQLDNYYVTQDVLRKINEENARDFSTGMFSSYSRKMLIQLGIHTKQLEMLK